MILEQIAQTIVENTSKIIDYPISITDKKGHIIGSTDPNRIGGYHKVSIDVLKKNQPVCYSTEDIKRLENVLPGVATPIVFNNQSIGVLGIVGEPEEVKRYALLVKSHVEMLFNESFKKEMVVLETKTLDTLVHYLLQYDEKEDSQHIVRYGKMLGYDFSIDRVCMIIDINFLSLNLPNRGDLDKLSFQHLQQELIQNVKYHFVDHKQDIISLLTLEQFIIMKAINTASHNVFMKTIEHKLHKLNQFLKKKFDSSASIAIGNAKSGIMGIKESYENAMKTMLAGKRTSISPQIYQYNDWQITLELVTKELTPFMMDKLHSCIANLIDYDNFDTLSSTFIAYCKYNMNLSETARNLFIHRNSLVYRLEKIAELTSLNPANFEHCLLLCLAIRNYLDSVTLKRELKSKNA